MTYTWDWSIFLQEVSTGGERYYQWIASGTAWTIATALSAWVLALVLGSAVGILRTLPHRAWALLGDAYVEFFRNIPLLVQMFLWFFVLPELVPEKAGLWLKQDMPLPEFSTAVVSLSFFTSARIAEQVKSGVQSLAGGQRLAAQALGLTLPQTYRYVLLPQTLRIVFPPLTSEFMNIFKNSSVALTIGVLELTAQARQMNEYTFKGFETFTVATLLYIFMAMSVNVGMGLLERKLRVPGFAGNRVGT